MRPRARTVWLAVLAVAIGTAAVLAGGLMESASASARTQSFALEARALPDRLRVSWNADLADVRAAQGGRLLVIDAGRVQRYPVPQSVLLSGMLDYLRHSDDVSLTMSIESDGKTTARGFVRMVGAAEAPKPAVAEPRPVVKPPPARRGSRRR